MVWLRSPTFAARAQHLGEFARYETTLGPRRSELAILVVARHWTSQYEWGIHAGEAARAGIPDEVIAAIAARQPPRLDDEAERLVFEFSSALVRSHGVPDDLYRATVAAIGEQATVELVGVLGYYTLVAMTLNTFEIAAPAGGQAPLVP
jgi:4-carboxymuconolactone decarboxylase